MYIEREQYKFLEDFFKSHVYQVLVIYGARRVGKTTLARKFLEENHDDYLFKSGDDIQVQEILSSQSLEKLKSFIGKHKTVFIDEAQRIENIGFSLKILVDAIPDLKILVTGSSSLDLGKQIGEPLGGRAKILRTYPLAQCEIQRYESYDETLSRLESRLIYGSYPVIITHNDDVFREEYLLETVESYLLKDILEFSGIRNSHKVKQLLRLLAFQIGKEVSYNELGTKLEMSKDTVGKYLDLLEQSFVIFSRPGLGCNPRQEITRNYHYYFFDNGIRNALINNFNALDYRNDLGMLWENYIIVERLKRNEYFLRKKIPSYFWRTYSQQEIDLVEDKGGTLYGYEIKYSKEKSKTPPQWLKSYPEAGFEIVNKENYLGFISKGD